jgi:hypothetical protein
MRFRGIATVKWERKRSERGIVLGSLEIQRYSILQSAQSASDTEAWGVESRMGMNCVGGKNDAREGSCAV